MKTSVFLFVIMYLFIFVTTFVIQRWQHIQFASGEIVVKTKDYKKIRYYSCKYHQERATVTYRNPKYVSKATCFTMRSKRRDHYRTNVTVAITQAWSNNVTMKISYQSPMSAIDFNFVSKICDVFTHSWYQKFLGKFSSVTWSCPVLPASYEFINIDLDQSVLPLPLPSGKNIMNLQFYITRTHELLLDGQVIIVAD